MFETAFHLAAFAGAKTDNTANENAPAVADQALTTTANNRYLSPADVEVFAATAINDTITRARITAPSLRNEGLPEVYPLMVSDAQSANPVIAQYLGNGPRIKRNEEFGMETSNGASAVDRINAALWFRERMFPVKPGKRFSVFGTSAQTLIQGGWTLGGITFDQVLPVGRYQVIGMNAVCNDGLFCRLVFPRSGSYRPGVICAEAAGGFVMDDPFRAGRLGAWGEFDQVAQPQLEILGHTAGAETAQVILDLVRISDSITY